MKAGDVVALAKIGAVLPNGVEIKKAKIRGQASEGMLCSEQELKLAEESAGIMILPAETPPGRPLADALGLSDWLLEVEITPNRGDCLSVLGVARELASITGEKVVLPDVSYPGGRGRRSATWCPSTVSDPDLCPRYSARVVTGVTIAPSPGLDAAAPLPVRHPPDQQRRRHHQLPAARGRASRCTPSTSTGCAGPGSTCGPRRNR